MCAREIGGRLRWWPALGGLLCAGVIMSTGATIAHVILFVGVTLTIAVLYSAVRANDRMHVGKPVDRRLLDPGFHFATLVFFGLPAIGCGLYLHSRGLDSSGRLVALAAGLVGVLLGYIRANRTM